MSSFPLLLLSILPQAGEPLRERCDTIDVNTVYSDDGSLVFVQLLFLDWQPWYSSHDIRAWRLVKTKDCYPVRTPYGWRLTFSDGDVLRVIECDDAHWTAEIGDKEVWQRDVLPSNQRRELTPPRRAGP